MAVHSIRQKKPLYQKEMEHKKHVVCSSANFMHILLGWLNVSPICLEMLFALNQNNYLKSKEKTK